MMTMKTDYLLSLDAGGTKTRALAYRADDFTPVMGSEVFAGPGNLADSPDAAVRSILEAAGACSKKAEAILGGALLFWSGRLSLSKALETGSSSGNNGEAQVEIRVNPDKVWSCLRTTVLAIDKNLQEAADVVSYEKNRLSASIGNGITPEEADLFSAILESAYSQKNDDPDDASALETISAVRYYLHRKQVETVDYGGGKREWFELLPGRQGMTLRPALTRDGALIRKGLAVSPQ